MHDRRGLWLLIAIPLFFVVAIWFDLFPLLRGPNEWQWTLRVLQVPLVRVAIPVVLLAVYALLCARWITAFNHTDRSTRPLLRTERGFLIFLTCAAPLIQLALAAAVWRSPIFEFFSATMSPAVTGFHSVAVTTPDLDQQLAHYATFMTTLPIHPQTHPPGLVLIQWIAWRFFQTVPALSELIATPLRMLQCHNVALMTLDNSQLASATIGMLVPLVGGLTVWPMYAFGRRVIGPRGAALAAMVFPVMPMFAMWPSQWDQVYPLFLCTALYLLHGGLESRSAWRILVAGIVLSCATFLSVGNMVMIAISGLYGLVWWTAHSPVRQLLDRQSIAMWARQALLLALGCSSIWLLYALLYRVSWSDFVAVASRLLSESTRCPMCLSTTRSYQVWVTWNVIDFAMFLSIPLVIVFLMGLPILVRGLRDSFRRRRYVAWVPLAVATLLMLVVLDLMGIVRGEVSRIWAYFGPLIALLAFLPEKDAFWQGSGRRAGLLVGLISLQLVVMNTRWQPYPSLLDEPPERQANYATPRPQVSTDVSFGHQISLAGYDLSSTVDRLDLDLYWQAQVQPPHSYTVFVHVLDANGRIIAQQDNMPVRDQLPTSCWRPQEFITDTYTIPLPGNTQSPLSIEAGLYRLDTGERLIRDDASGTSVVFALPQN